MKKRIIYTVIIICVIATAIGAFVLSSRGNSADNTGNTAVSESENAVADFNGELIESVFPSDTVSLSPSEKLNVMVVAYSLSEVTVKLGTRQFKAVPEETEKPGYTAFTAEIQMPGSYEELSSVGMITVIASYNGQSVQKKGAMIKASEGITFAHQETTQDIDEEIQNEISENSDAEIENYIPELPSEYYTMNSTSFTPETTMPIHTVTSQASLGQQVGKMCVITSPYADTWHLVRGDDTYAPYYSTLCRGTVDYITGESEAYNEDDEKVVYFYELASGRKVRKEYAEVYESAPLKDNSLQVLSCASENGTVKITLKTDWRVPYNINYTPQNYFSAHSKNYNVSSFTADRIEFTFFHTDSVKGKADVSGSNVVSSADFDVSRQQKTATLTLKLKNQGQYYGSNLSYDSAGNIVITINNKPQSVGQAVVMLDPGHGGSEPGAVGLSGAVKEKDVNLAIAHRVKTALEAKGIKVIMTRYGNETLTLEQRKAIMRQYKPDLFVAIHSNGSHNTDEIGTSTYYYKPFSRKLADNIYKELLSVYKSDVYAGSVELFDEISDGTIFYPFSVTRVEECPSVLVEVGFMTNDDECRKLIDSENQRKFGEAIAKGIEQTILS